VIVKGRRRGDGDGGGGGGVGGGGEESWSIVAGRCGGSRRRNN